MMPEELRKGITSNPELGFEHGNSRWKDLDEQKMMEISGRGFEMIEKRKILMPHPSKGYLRGWVCYKVVSEQETTLGLLGLMNESHKNLIRELLRGNTLSYSVDSRKTTM
jgi:hypothetical protein